MCSVEFSLNHALPRPIPSCTQELFVSVSSQSGHRLLPPVEIFWTLAAECHREFTADSRAMVPPYVTIFHFWHLSSYCWLKLRSSYFYLIVKTYMYTHAHKHAHTHTQIHTHTCIHTQPAAGWPQTSVCSLDEGFAHSFIHRYRKHWYLYLPGRWPIRPLVINLLFSIIIISAVGREGPLM